MKDSLYTIVSLGCPKNLVDTEVICGILEQNGSRYTEDIEKADAVIVNTCSFINEARKESESVISQVCALKKNNPRCRIAVAGCMTTNMDPAFMDSINGLVDLFIQPGDTGNPRAWAALLNGTDRQAAAHTTQNQAFLYDHLTPRMRVTPFHYAYIKIAEGCSNTCTFCTIPSIKGLFRSRPVASIVKEARGLIAQEVKEIILIAQDTSSYGTDIGTTAASLIRALGALSGDIWIRLLYTYPASFSDDLINAIADTPAVCPYIDIPLQHSEDRILKLMGRQTTKTDIKKLIEKIRDRIPGAGFRTSLIVGFPSETEREFDALRRFVKEIQFERLGLFRYSDEPGTPASRINGKISSKTINQRYDTLFLVQQEAARAVTDRLIGSLQQVIIDGTLDDDDTYAFIGRTRWDSPEVDGTVYIEKTPSCAKYEQGSIVPVTVTHAQGYDIGGVIHEPAQ